MATTIPNISLMIKIREGKQNQTTTARTPLYRRTRQSRPPAAIFRAMEGIINTLIDRPLKSSRDPRKILTGNFSPVDELPPTECKVIEGSLPPCLDGTYIRNGPNPQFQPNGPYHLFEDDGMLHCIRISKGKATLCSRYVKTYRYEVEHKKGHSVIPSMFSGFNGLLLPSATRALLAAAKVLAGEFDPANGIGHANTSLALIGGKLYALAESDLPYAVKVDSQGEVHTLGRHDFDGKLVECMTAHPKTDPKTGETFAFRYGWRHPFVTLFRFDAKGKKHPDVAINSVTTCPLLHDFAITKRYAIFIDIQIVIDPMAVVVGGGPVAIDRRKVPRIGVIPRYAKNGSEMRWFEVPGFNVFHVANAWDEDDGDVVVMVAPNILSVENTFERMDLVHACIEKVRIELKTGVVSRYPLSTMNLGMSVINPAFVGRKNRYIYAPVGDPQPKVSGVVKLDLLLSERERRRDCVVASKFFGPSCYGGEPFFVAREQDCTEADEDDGYLLSYVHDENSGESRFLVMDAKTHNLDIIAVLRLPAPVPYGFHGLFVREIECDML